ncbi:MAG TPA: SusC/RagA family TonB-linked outer membrane protein [Prolixibacteraceae bacterium]|nr:SusC/RagA family TonB-linked outer membrane protein [Prolixibacteraceae bacterium]
MKRIALLLMFFTIGLNVLWAQTREIQGIVTSADDGSSVPGVSVSVKGTTLGTITDMDGAFKLRVPQDAKTLVFSFVGMTTKDVEIGNESVFKVQMESDNISVGEVVVTAMGIAKEKKAVGYAVSEFKSDELENVQVLDASTALQGKVAGVSISPSSGAPGASTRVLVRGVSSLTGSNQPLYVIDGVPVNNQYASANSTAASTSATRTVDFGNAASDINPDDIESISILKGAAATSLYGSRAANGVILINTKRGKKNQDLLVNFSSSYSLMEVGRLPYYQKEFGQGWSNHFAFEENGSWGPKLDGKMRLIGNIVDNSQQLAPFRYMENALTDFYEYGYTTDNSLSLSGGTDLMGYLVSFTNAKSDGIIPGESDVLDRNSFLFKANGGTEKTKIDFTANYSNKKLSAVATGQGDDAGGGKTIFQEILQNPINHYIPQYRDYKNKFNNLDNYFNRYAQNPYWIINMNGNEFKQDRLIASTNISRELAKGLKLAWKGGLDTYSYMLKDWGAVATINDGTPNASGNDVFGMVKEEARTVKQLDSDLILTYNGNLNMGGDNALEYNILLGNNINERTGKRLTTISKGLVVPEYYNVANISGSAEVSTNEYIRRLVGAYAQIDLSYNNYLFLQLNARKDWSSTLPIGNNSFFYPGANLGFVFTDLMEKNPFLTYGKIRASYAYAGNDADPYQIDPYYNAGIIRAGGYGQTLYPVGGIPAYEKGSVLGNPNLKPEISKEFEVGGELRFFNNRFGFDAAYYEKVTTDLIMLATIASSSGYLSQTTNLGQISNKGFELSVNATPLKIGDFKWDMTYTFTKSNTILDELSEELGISEYIINSAYEAEFVAIPGKQLGQFRIPGYQYTPDGKVVVGETGLPLEGDPIYVGSSVPDYNMSLSNTLSYKGLKLSALLDYQKGGYMYSYTSSITYWSGNNEQSITNYRRPWVIPNSVQQTGTDANGNPVYTENSTPVGDDWSEYYSQNTNKPIESERIIEKTYFRVRELSLSCRLGKSFNEKLNLASSTLSLYGRNLLLWTPADNSFIDPETSTYGNDLEGMFGEFGGAPSVRTYGVKLNVSF